MPAKEEYTAEFKEQAVRFVLEEIEPHESASTRVIGSRRSRGESGDVLQLGEAVRARAGSCG